MQNRCFIFIFAVCLLSFAVVVRGLAQKPISARLDSESSLVVVHAPEVSFGTSNEPEQRGQLPAPDACATIQKWVEELPPTGGVIDARMFQGKQVCNSNVVLSKPATVLLGATEFDGEGLWYVTSSGVVIRGLSQGSTVIRYAGSVTPTAVIELGREPNRVSVREAIVGIEISNLTVDANSRAQRAIFGFHVRRGLIDNVAALNANGNANISFYGLTESAKKQSQDITVQNCYISGNTTAAAYGDGIYFSGIVRPRAINNTISNVTRIGIVTEGDGPERKSSDALIAHNTIFNVRDHGAGNLNAAIWLENTNGGRVIGNHGFDLSGGVQKGGSRGIVIAGGSDVPSTFMVTSNIISGAKEPLVIGVTAGSAVFVDGFAMYAGNVNDGRYRLGVEVTRGRIIRINNIFFGDNDFTRAGGSTGGLVVVYASGDVESLSVTNATKGTIVHNSLTADINISNLRGFSLDHLSLSGLRAPRGDKWTYRQGGTGTFRRMTVVDSDFDRTPTSGSFPPDTNFACTPGNERPAGSEVPIRDGLDGEVLVGAKEGPMVHIGR